MNWKCMETLIFHFMFPSILFPVKLQLLRSLWAPLTIVCSLGHAWPHSMNDLVEIFILFWLSVHMQKNQCDPVIPSGGICDQRFLQTNWLKAFPAITQGQEFFQTWDLYSQIDNNNNCYLRTFPAKINYKIFHNNGKTLFLCHVWLFFCCFCPKAVFAKKCA